MEDIADATIDGTRKECMQNLATVPLLIIGDLGMRKLPPTAAEELLEIVMRRYERTSTLLTSNRPVEDWGKLLGDSAAVTAMLAVFYTTVTSSSADHGVGELKRACPSPSQRGRTTPSRAIPLAGFAVTIVGRM